MKQVLVSLLSSFLLLSCSKKDTPPQAIDYSQYKLKQTIRSYTNYSSPSPSYSTDTSDYSYNGSTIYLNVKRNSGTPLSYTIMLENNIYTQIATHSTGSSIQKTFFRLNAAGLIDSNWISNNATVTQGGSLRYNTNGTKDIEIYDYTNYKNIKKYQYVNGVNTYALTERIAMIPSIPPAKDSVVYEYTALPFRTDFLNTGMPATLYGKADKYLLKKATHYNQLDNNAIRQTTEYVYKTNEIGLITQKIMNIYTQPGNVILLADTTNYVYY